MVLEVEDQGVGIETSELDQVRTLVAGQRAPSLILDYQIFERFHRLERTRDIASGTGIGKLNIQLLCGALTLSFEGLALTLEMCKVLHGQLDVRSELNVGSVFSFVLSGASNSNQAHHVSPHSVTFRRGYFHLPSESVSHDPHADESATSKNERIVEAQIKDATQHRSAVFMDAHRDSTASSVGGQSASTSGASASTGGDYFGEEGESHSLHGHALHLLINSMHSQDLSEMRNATILRTDRKSVV